MNNEERKNLISKGLIKVGLGLITFPFNFIAGLIVMYLGLDDLSTIDNNGHKENLSSHILDFINNNSVLDNKVDSPVLYHLLERSGENTLKDIASLLLIFSIIISQY